MPIEITKPILVTPQNTCFEYLVIAEAAIAGYLAGHVTQASGVGRVYEQGEKICQACFVERVEVEYYPAKILEPIIKGSWPSTLDIGFHSSAASPSARGSLDSRQRLMGSLHEHAFISYYASVEDRIKKEHGEFANWPKELRFAKIVRNAFAHGGCINIDDGERTGEWRGASFGSNDKGTQVMYNRLSAGDLVILMLDMDLLLEEGCSETPT